MGFLGILEDKVLLHVPGTVTLDENPANTHIPTDGMKLGTGKNSHIVLVPQPSNDPNDPLNWPAWKKAIVTIITGFGTIIFGAVMNPLLNAVSVVIANDYNVTVSKVTLLAGYQTLITAGTAPLVSAISKKHGRRSISIFASLSGLVGNIVGSATKDYTGLVAARVVQGLSVAAYEALFYVTIGDIYFVHKRGFYVAIATFILAAVSNLTSVICGAISQSLGWRYIFRIFIPISALQLILQFIFVPETAYRRDSRFDIDELQVADSAQAKNKNTVGTHIENMASQEIPQQKTIVQEMRIFTGVYTEENILKLVLGPFVVLLNPVITFATLAQSWFVGAFVSIAYCLNQIFLSPPYNLSTLGIGNLSIGPFLGGLLGLLLLGAINDPLIKFISRRNHGVYEPEYRLLLSILSLAMPVGLIAFGYAVQHSLNLYLTAFSNGVAVFRTLAMITATSSYLLDAYRSMSNEIFIIGMSVRSFILYTFSYLPITGRPDLVLWQSSLLLGIYRLG
ncbi:MFS general substrate transporter [Penicillium malachiteum]|uniref:MFS general substrate transporter n=1 Tax=Penicillium malachiteum TaxID=1324776 RepID=A0AAD6HMI0_9EURO|nr:MFS general substrate transporter [Penicillium malachiteum]